MKHTFVEVTNGPNNWGKFLVSKWELEDWRVKSAVHTHGLLASIGENQACIWILDLQTGEGARFRPGGSAKADLEKHAIWVCPMYECFLEWLYAHPEHHQDPITTLPHYIDLPDAPFAMQGYRRKGPKK
jgi:hypothetical protein